MHDNTYPDGGSQKKGFQRVLIKRALNGYEDPATDRRPVKGGWMNELIHSPLFNLDVFIHHSKFSH